uniref:Uncharacterized protein n=1 Tax=Kuetzingia canaliculata TaxID=228262 RepID=A0A1Z1MPH7_KUECA|nr:hypothetical protein [Kuetzingia canaliculata]ARW67846.1 hypothetical protein [Kuetzingia canaliculata]
MQSNLKNIYQNKYPNSESDYNYTIDNNNISEEMPTGWSFICLDEAINYYTDCNNKNIDCNNQNN